MSREFSLKQKKKEELVKLVIELEKDYTKLNQNIKALDSEYKIRLNSLVEDRDKISKKLAIAELEKVKELLSYNYIIHEWIPHSALKNKIDNQIKLLKE